VQWPKDLKPAENGLTYHTIRVRQMRLPPELTQRVWDCMKLRWTDAPIVVLPLGKVCDFEDQPLTSGVNAIGLTCADFAVLARYNSDTVRDWGRRYAIPYQARLLLYLLEEAARHGKTVWVLDRPNPAGRPVEGLTLLEGWESFVGAGPIPMRHGLTLGELGHWFIAHFKIDVDYRVIEMQGYRPDDAPGFGWPSDERIWVNPSPNAANLNMARAYAGTVMVEGATLSEGRGTTRPLELFGAPDIDASAVGAEMERLAPEWLALRSKMLRALEPYPEACGALGAALIEAEHAGR
jgi:hypothetical protein